MKRLDKSLKECVVDLLEFCDKYGFGSENIGTAIAVVENEPGISYTDPGETKELEKKIERLRRKVNGVPYDIG